MEILNTSRIGGEGLNKILKWTALGAVLSLAACSSLTRRTTHSTPPSSSKDAASRTDPAEVFGPFPVATPAQGPATPSVLVENPDRIVLVFGKGLAHGYAYFGVLKALQELKINVSAIYATEIGALAGALYYTAPNPNRMDWALLRFNEKNLIPKDGKFSFRLGSPEEGLEKSLREVFGEKRIESMVDRLHISLEDVNTGEQLEARSGDVWKVVRGALAGTHLFSPIEIEGRIVRASNRKLSESFRLARQNEKYPVVVVVASESPPTELFRKWVEDEKATLLYVPLSGMNDRDIKQRNQAVFSGKNVVHKAAKEILSLVGRKPE